MTKRNPHPSVPGSDFTHHRLPQVCWEGPQMVNHSLALVNREMELALIETRQVNLSILPVGDDNFSALLSPRSKKLMRFFQQRASFPVDVHVRHQWPPNWTAPPVGHWVVIQPWEYGGLPLEWVQRINESVDEAWVPSTFVAHLYTQSGVDPERVHVIPNGVDPDFFKPGGRKFPIPSTRGFKFLFVGGTIYRKGVDILLQAYRRAFTREEDVALVIKDMGTRTLYEGQGMIKQIRAFAAAPNAPPLIYMDDDLSDNDMVALYNACDCLVHPYRGEGFGLPVLEAMACGMPVIVTAGGATDDFADAHVGHPIPSSRRVFGNREISGVRTIRDLWMLEPDVEVLAEKMRWTYDHKQETRIKGECARKRAAEHWTWQKSAERALERINVLQTRPVLRHQQQVDAVVLIDLKTCRGQGALPLKTTLDSLKRNSYGQLEVVLWIDSPTTEDDLLLDQFKGLLTLRNLSFRTVIQEICRQFRTALMVLAPVPLWFSKQWVAQILEASRKSGTGPKIFAPSSNFEDSKTFVPFEGSLDEYTFQKYARTLWRKQRGVFQGIDSSVPCVVAVTRECLESLPDPGCLEWPEWIAALQRGGCPTYWLKDTYLLRPTSPTCPPPVFNSAD